LQKLRRVMLEVADQNPQALKEPKPELFFVGFGDSALILNGALSMHFAPKHLSSLTYIKTLRRSSGE